MSCELDIKDIVDEYLIPGNIRPDRTLPVEQVAGVLTGIRKNVDQDQYTISSKGVGLYGLGLDDLQLTCVVKQGLNFSTDLSVALADNSIYTGKYNIKNVDDLLNDEGLQRTIANVSMISKMESLRAQGLITGNETDEELAKLAALAAKYSPSNIKDYLLGKADDLLTTAMDALAVLAVTGAVISAIKNADILGKLKGFGKQIASLPDLALNTINTADIDAAANEILRQLVM